jgi:hypothetical protein
MKHTTREKDLHVLNTIERAFGDRSLDALHLADFWRWYEAANKPKAPGKPERVRRAWGIIKKLRELFSYGVAAELRVALGFKASCSKPGSPSPLDAG